MEEKICQNCGQKNKADAVFCFNCGKNLDMQTQNINVQNNIENNKVQKTNGFAIASLITGIINILFISIWIPLITISLSLTAKQKIKAFNEKGNGLATAGLVLGIIGTVLWGLNLLLTIAGIITK